MSPGPYDKIHMKCENSGKFESISLWPIILVQQRQMNAVQKFARATDKSREWHLAETEEQHTKNVSQCHVEARFLTEWRQAHSHKRLLHNWSNLKTKLKSG